MNVRGFYSSRVDFFNSKFTTKEQFFEEATKKLKMLEYVEDSFESAIMTREMSFPTGLELGHINIAIPHTDPQHVKPFVAAYQLNNPIEFVQMATTDSLVPCELILILGITDPKIKWDYYQQLWKYLEMMRRFLNIEKSNHQKSYITFTTKSLN